MTLASIKTCGRRWSNDSISLAYIDWTLAGANTIRLLVDTSAETRAPPGSVATPPAPKLPPADPPPTSVPAPKPGPARPVVTTPLPAASALFAVAPWFRPAPPAASVGRANGFARAGAMPVRAVSIGGKGNGVIGTTDAAGFIEPGNALGWPPPNGP